MIAPQAWFLDINTKQPASLCRSAPRGAGAHSGDRLQTGLGPERRVTAPGKGRFSRPGWPGSHSMAGFPNTACPRNSRHARARENGCFRGRVYLLSPPLCESGNWAPAGQVSQGWKPVTWRRGPPGCPAQEAPGGVASSDVSGKPCSWQRKRSEHECRTHTGFFRVSQVYKSCFPAGAHPALCSLTPPPPQHTHLCTSWPRAGVLASPPRCSSRVISQPCIHDP